MMTQTMFEINSGTSNILGVYTVVYCISHSMMKCDTCDDERYYLISFNLFGSFGQIYMYGFNLIVING